MRRQANDTFVPKRGRPSLKQVELIDRVVIDAASRLFLANGFDAVTMEQVAAGAGVSKGTLYARHASKVELLTAVIERSIADWSDEASLRDHLLTEDIEQMLRHHASIIARWVNRDDVVSLQRIIGSVQHRFPELAETMHQHGYLYIVGVIARDIEAAGLRDGVPVSSAETVARVLVASVNGANWQEGEVMSGKQLEAFAQRVVDLLLAARSSW